MRKFNKVIDEMVDELVRMAEENAEIKEYLCETYGTIAEDNTTLAVIDYIATYYCVSDDIADLHR